MSQVEVDPKEPKQLKLIGMKYLENFRKELFLCSDPFEVEARLEWFLDYYEPINISTTYTQHYWRARKSETGKGYNSVSEVMAPPVDLTKVGRMNEKGKPTFYASATTDTALSEVHAEKGDFFHLIGLKTIKSIRCLLVGEVLNAYQNTSQISQKLTAELQTLIEKLSPEDKRRYVFMDAFVSEIFRDPKAREKDYLYSRTLCRLMKARYSDVDGIIYPSVQHEGSSNIAITPDVSLSNMVIEMNSVVRIAEKYSYRMYEPEIIQIARGATERGSIIW